LETAFSVNPAKPVSKSFSPRPLRLCGERLPFSLIELLGCPACDQLNRSWDGFAFAAVEYEQVDVVRSGHIVEDPQSVAFLGFKEPHSKDLRSLWNLKRNSLLWHRWVMCHAYPGMKYRLALSIADAPRLCLNGHF